MSVVMHNNAMIAGLAKRTKERTVEERLVGWLVSWLDACMLGQLVLKRSCMDIYVQTYDYLLEDMKVTYKLYVSTKPKVDIFLALARTYIYRYEKRIAKEKKK